MFEFFSLMPLVPLHRGYDGLELWQDFRVDEKLDAAGGCGFSGNPSIAFEG